MKRRRKGEQKSEHARHTRAVDTVHSRQTIKENEANARNECLFIWKPEKGRTSNKIIVMTSRRVDCSAWREEKGNNYKNNDNRSK